MESISLPELYCPFPPEINPHADAVQQHTTDWVVHNRLVRSPAAYERFCASKFGRLAARAYPAAELEELEIVSDWNTWLFMLDDQCDESGIGKQPVRLRALFDHFMAILRSGGAKVDVGPLGESLAELWGRIQSKARAHWIPRFVRSAEDYFDSCVWEATNRSGRITPPVADYVRMRPLTGGLLTDVDLIDVAMQIDLPDDVRLHSVLQVMTANCNNVVCWSNDIISLSKEVRRGDVHNLVLAIQHEYRCSLQEAVDEAARRHDCQVRSFIELERQLTHVGIEVTDTVERYVGVLRSWMRGNLDWSFETGRYWPTKVVHVDGDPEYLEKIHQGV